jgi:hypothetical protein
MNSDSKTVFVAFSTHPSTVELLNEARKLAPQAVAWVHSVHVAPRVQLTIEIDRSHFDNLVGAMEGNVEHAVAAAEQELIGDLAEIVEVHPAWTARTSEYLGPNAGPTEILSPQTTDTDDIPF